MAKLSLALAVAGLMAIMTAFSGSKAADSKRSELIGLFDAYRPAIGALDTLSPSPLDYHKFDYTRPDFAGSMDVNLMSGSVGFPSYHFFKQTGGADTQFLAITPQMQAAEAAHMLQQSAAVESFAQYPPQVSDSRSLLPNEDRAEAARCNGLLHACANWMALRTGKMRVITYDQGSWCTDDEILGKACYNEKKAISKDRVYDIPREGEAMSDELWLTIKQSCPLVDDCAKPRAWSETEGHSVYAALPTILAQYMEAEEALQDSCSSCVAMRVNAQRRAILARRWQ